MPNEVLLLLGDNGEGRWTAEMEFRSLLGESGAESNRCLTLAAGGGVTVRSINSSPWLLSRSVSDPEGVAPFISIVEIIVCETTRGRDPSDNFVEVDADDVVEDDDGIGDRADRPNAGEGELNRIPLSLSSAWGCKDNKLRSDGSHAFREESHLLVPLRQAPHSIQRGNGVVRGRRRGRNGRLPLSNSKLRGLILIVVLSGFVMGVIQTVPAHVSTLAAHGLI